VKRRDGRTDDDHDWERSAQVGTPKHAEILLTFISLQDSAKRPVSPPPRSIREEAVDSLRQVGFDPSHLSGACIKH